MIPTAIRLTNFLAYQDHEPINLTGIRLACLSGHNGAGKSTLFDAMTWALWGKARSKRDDELIHQGAIDMSVQLDFEQDEQSYRVIRKRVLSGKSSKGTLDLLAKDSAGEWQIISEPTNRWTQAKLDDILRLDYDTFIHSAYLQQGRADLFATNLPSERKRILGDILQLDQWSVFDADAKDLADDLAGQMKVIQHDIGRSQEECADEEETRRELAVLTETCAQANAQLDEATEEYSKIANSHDRLQETRQQKSGLELTIVNRRQAIQNAKVDVDRRETEIAEHQSMINQASAIEAGYATLKTARGEQAEILEKIQRIQEIDELSYQQRQALDAASVSLAKQANAQREQIRVLAGRIADVEQYDIDAINAKLADMAQHRNDAAGLAQKLSQTESEIAGINARLDVISGEGASLNERLEQLEATDGGDCPLCNQPLTAMGKIDLIAQIEADVNERRDRYAKGRTLLATKQADAATFNRELDNIALLTADEQTLQRQKGMIEAKRGEALKAAAVLPDQKVKLRAIEDQLNTQDYAHDIRQRLAELQTERDAVGYDPDAYEAVREKIALYDQFEALHTRLAGARSGLEQSREYVASLKSRLATLEQELAEAQTTLEKIDTRIEALQRLAALEVEKRQALDGLRAEVNSLTENIAIKQQELNAIEVSKARLATLEQRLVDRRHEHGLYTELREAFGKNGVPALIIETAIPEVESEANELLGRMTDGLMSIQFHTQREKITGGTAETLDIEIQDELGARSYDMYSGGEAFRINLALRIALSKVLAKRAGARLRALFIDEGFGSQDGSGRSKLVEAINRIQDDFDMILVITHIEELRDSFPVQLMVEKTNRGSQVTLRSA